MIALSELNHVILRPKSGLLEMTARELSANRRCDARFDVKGAISAEEVAAAKSRNLASTVE